MKEEELIKKLENAELPDIKLQSHRNRLRMALLNADYPQKQRGWRRFVQGAGETVLKFLKSPRPLWKPLVFGAMALALVIGLTVATLLSDDNSQVAIASGTITIDQNTTIAYDFEGHRYNFEDYGTIELLLDSERSIMLFQNNGERRTLTINMQAREMTLAEIEEFGGPDGLVEGPEDLVFNESDQQQAIDIASADEEIAELLAQGAVISKVIEETIPYFGVIDSEIVLDGAVASFSTDHAIVLIERGDEYWIAHIDLVEGTVKSLAELTE